MKRLTTLVLAFALAVPVFAHIKFRIDFEKDFDFSKAKTFAWSPGVGDIMLARTPKDDPETTRKLVEPIIVDTTATVLPTRGLQMAKDKPDLTARYYLLLTIGDQNQVMGQFVPTVLDWGLPLFAPATTSYKVIQTGALVIDLRAGEKVVWRAVAEAEIKMDMPQDKRAKLLADAVKQTWEKYPPKQKK